MIDLDQLEGLVRAGKFQQVAGIIEGLNAKKIPRGDAARLANLANRAEQSRFALRVLYPIVRSEQEAIVANDRERIEYADALRRTGLLNEALELLATVDASTTPSAHLTAAICLFNKWQYAEAMPHLRRLVAVTQPEDYLNVIARVNLAAACVHEEFDDEALELLEGICSQTRAAGQTLLLGNSLELMAQVFIRRKDWAGAGRVLHDAESIFAKDSGKYLSWVLKWRAVATSLKSGAVTAELLDCRERAIVHGHFEIHRDCDLFIGAIREDFQLLHKVYFGTSNLAFRKRIARFAPGLKAPESYLWLPSGGEPEEIFDLLAGSVAEGPALKRAGLLHQLMILLCSDFYRPTSIGAVFNTLFASERYGQQGSANRVSQLVRRLRRWCESNELGLTIVEQHGKYRLQASPATAVRVPAQMPDSSRQAVVWSQVKSQIPPRMFTRSELEEISHFSSTNTKRLLRWALDTGEVETVGSGSAIRYRLVA
jgi:hypothetical protein